jgi:hypothetical protein
MCVEKRGAIVRTAPRRSGPDASGCLDLNTTYIGCDDACAEAILAAPELEVLAIDPATGIDFDSGVINASPRTR